MTRIREIHPGICLTSGTVECDAPIESPYTQTPSACYRYNATELRSRKEKAGYDEFTLGSGSRLTPFMLRDGTGSIFVQPEGGEVLSYSHQHVFKSKSGSKSGVGSRIRKLKEMDRQQYGDGKKKPFFRKIEDRGPLNIPDDLVELSPGSPEAKSAHRKYYEHRIQPGDRIYLMGKASVGPDGSVVISKDEKSSPLFLAAGPEELKAGAFKTKSFAGMAAAAGFAVVAVVLIYIGFSK